MPNVTSQLCNCLQCVWRLRTSTGLDVWPNDKPANEGPEPPGERQIGAEVGEDDGRAEAFDRCPCSFQVLSNDARLQ